MPEIRTFHGVEPHLDAVPGSMFSNRTVRFDAVIVFLDSYIAVRCGAARSGFCVFEIIRFGSVRFIFFDNRTVRCGAVRFYVFQILW